MKKLVAAVLCAGALLMVTPASATTPSECLLQYNRNVEGFLWMYHQAHVERKIGAITDPYELFQYLHASVRELRRTQSLCGW